MQKILLVQRQSPFNTSKGREAFDMAMALAAVEHSVTVLFTGDAVYQLLLPADQNDFMLKPYQKGFKLFSLYDIEQVLVSVSALKARGLAIPHLLPDITAVNDDDIQQLIAQQHQVITS